MYENILGPFKNSALSVLKLWFIFDRANDVVVEVYNIHSRCNMYK